MNDGGTIRLYFGSGPFRNQQVKPWNVFVLAKAYAAVYGKPAEDFTQKPGPLGANAAELMRALDLDALTKQSAKKLSGGETARMALARLLMRQYQLLILDEPTSAMDMESTLAAERLISDCCRQTGCAVLLITHSIQQAKRLADRVLFLYRGELIEQGAAERLLFAPTKEETKQFLEFYGV